MASCLGFNIEGNDLGNRRDTIINELKSYRANWHLCLGDEALAVSLLKHTDKGVIYRIFDPFNEYKGGANKTFDNSVWSKHSPQELVNYVNNKLSHLKQYPNLVFSIGNNEPSTRGQTKAFVKWCVELAHLGFDNGIRFAIAEIASAKSVEHHEISAGLWDDFIETMHQYRGFHIVTFHEYTTGILPATFLPDYPLNLDNPQAFHHNNWSTSTMNLDSIDGNWHLGRGALITHVRAKQLGLEPIPFVITECAFDWMSDIANTPERAETLGHLENRFKMPNHDFMRGSTGHRTYHEWLMQETGYTHDWNQYLFDQYQWLARAYPPECEGFCIFALNGDWDLPEGHDMSRGRNDAFRALVSSVDVTHSQEPQPMPDVFDPELFDAEVSSVADSVFLRAGMSTNSAKQGSFQRPPTKMEVSRQTNNANGHDWYKYKRGDEVGYFADLDIVRVKYTEDAPSEPDSEIVQRLDALEATVNAQGLLIDTLFEPVVVDFPVGDMTMVVSRGFLPSYESFLKALGYTLTETAKNMQRARGGLPNEDADNELYSTVTVPDDTEPFTNDTGEPILNKDDSAA